MSLPSRYPLGYLRRYGVKPVKDLIEYSKQAKQQFCETGELVEAGKWVTLEQLMTDAKAGCERCFCLHESVLYILRETELTGNERLKWHGNRWFRPIISTDGTAHPDYMFDEAWTDSMVKSGRIHFLEIFHIPGTTARFENVPERNLLGDPSREDRFDSITDWMRTCVSEHQRCGPARKTRLPTRVIEVCDIFSPHVLLRAPAADMTDLYACLSHCWGVHPSTFQLTSENKHHLANSRIMLCDMPRTFVDAITITRKLKIPYLWIDSMCIVQDDNADWVRESLAMAEVYQNCAVTIAATASADSSTGCFLDSQLHQHKLLQLGRSELFIRRLPRPSGHGHGHRLCATADDGKLPLLQRGWVYQERLLSPRLVHFLENDVIWECNSSISCHCELDTLKEIFSDADHDTRIAPKLNHSSSFLFGADELRQRWLSVVEEYTPLGLTVPTDRLPALSGLATRFAAANRDNYVAGLWERTIVSDLLWHVSSVPTSRQSGFRAPSWSWASVTGSISYSFVAKKKLTLFTTSLESKPQIRNDSSGAIELTLSGQMVVVRSAWGGRSLTSSAGNEQNFDFYPDIRMNGMEMQGVSCHNQLYCFRVGQFDTRPSAVYFLVLRCLDASTQLYERVGIAECSDNDTLLSLVQSSRVITIK